MLTICLWLCWIMLINCSQDVFVTTQRKGAINCLARYFKLVTKMSSQGFLGDPQKKGEAYWTVLPVRLDRFFLMFKYLE